MTQALCFWNSNLLGLVSAGRFRRFSVMSRIGKKTGTGHADFGFSEKDAQEWR